MFIYALLRLHESLISQILITFSLRTSLPTHQLIFDKLCLLHMCPTLIETTISVVETKI